MGHCKFGRRRRRNRRSRRSSQEEEQEEEVRETIWGERCFDSICSIVDGFCSSQ
jgi:hypothetical protein